MQDETDNQDPVLASAVAMLRDADPPRDLWPAIHSQLTVTRRRGVVQVRWPVALAAGIALVAVSSFATARWVTRADVTAEPGVASGVRGIVPASTGDTDLQTARSIAQLQAVLDSNITTIGADTYRSLARSLAILDQAIADAARQQRAMPDDPAARAYLTSSLRKKLDVLEKATSLTINRS